MLRRRLPQHADQGRPVVDLASVLVKALWDCSAQAHLRGSPPTRTRCLCPPARFAPRSQDGTGIEMRGLTKVADIKLAPGSDRILFSCTYVAILASSSQGPRASSTPNVTQELGMGGLHPRRDHPRGAEGQRLVLCRGHDVRGRRLLPHLRRQVMLAIFGGFMLGDRMSQSRHGRQASMSHRLCVD
jgi:hypothetical protein